MTQSKINRSLKVESTGDFHRRNIFPAIRLKGKWLERAGFIPGGRVRLMNIAPGVMQLCYEQNPPSEIACL